MKIITFIIAHLGGGGAERITVLLANYFAKNGFKVHLIIFSDKYNEYDVDANIVKYVLPKSNNKVIDVLKKIHTLQELLSEIKPDYVCALGFICRYLFFSNLVKKYKFVLSERNAPQYQYPSKIELAMVKYCFKRAHHIIFQTEDAKQFFCKEIQNKSTIIPNPIKEGLPMPYTGQREKRIVAYCRLDKQKNIPMLLRVFKKYSELYPEYILEIYGRGDCENELKAYSKELGIEGKVKFKGFSANIHLDIRNALMFVSTSDFEGISNSMLESMAIGLPCVCTDCPVGGARMFIKDGENGFLVSVGDEKAFLEKMSMITENSKLADSISLEAMKIKEILDIEKICLKWINLMK